ncbi:hypothetical protein EDD11_005801 [Mortierella claussenii]|nr:hypothetical protein EDD11_005801 [Mortierella claussenii]
MIQCETCKVWQHCPCVGLGDGEVTPDKYYCDSCRPENHPYKVVNGQLISSSKPNSTQKPTKKRSTMNSKEASIPMDLMLAQQKWNEEHQDELEEEYTQRASTKRRKKTESSNTDFEDDAHTQEHHAKGSSPPSVPPLGPVTASAAGATASPPERKKLKSTKSTSPTPPKEQDTRTTEVTAVATASAVSEVIPSTVSAAATSTHLPPSTPKTPPSSTGRNGPSKKPSPKSASKARSRSSSPTVNGAANDFVREDSTTPKNHSHQQVPSGSSPTTSTKKSFPRRGGERGQSTKTGSRHSTPVPVEGTPQPMAPAAPATVRYPSSKMSIQDMTKRAKQLLDYISRVQIDMADRKSKSGSLSPQESGVVKISSTPHQHHSHVEDVEMRSVRGVSDEPTLFRLPASASVADAMHGDSQVCPDLSRSSMESTASSMDGIQEPSSPIDVKVPVKEASSGKEMTIKVVPMSSQDRAPLLSTPPLSVHDHHHHHRHLRHGSGTPDSEIPHEPLTPPHHPLDHAQDTKGTMSPLTMQDSQIRPDDTPTTSLELMDKLTGDLIRFQEKFGAYA